MIICGLDFETTGLDPKVDRVVEVGAVMWDWEKQKPLRMLSEYVDTGIEVSPEAFAVHGISQEEIELYGVSETSVFRELSSMLEVSDYAMAHFGKQFDKLFFGATVERLGTIGAPAEWIDTAEDIKYPEAITTRNLRHLAAEHGFLNPFGHRAVFDVITMLKVASQYDIEEIIARAAEPTLIVCAQVSFKDKDMAKTAGFRWAPNDKVWWKSLKQSDFESAEFEFTTTFLSNPPE